MSGVHTGQRASGDTAQQHVAGGAARQRVFVHEVCARDGLQMEPHFVPTDDKVALIDALSACGFARIEVTSFVSAKAVPALADAEAVMRRIRRAPGVVYAALVPNLRGMERAIESGADELNLVMSCSEAHNRANLRRDREASRAQLMQVLRGAAAADVHCHVSLSTAFGCPFDGDVPLETVRTAALDWWAAGATGITLCDTTGMADPRLVRRTVEALSRDLPIDALTLHLHDTRGMGLANALAGLELGVRRFDAACAGLGGCPFAPGASGNVATEALVHMLACMEVDTGVDLDALLRIGAALPALVQRPLHNPLLLAGPRTRRHPAPAEGVAAR
ncbi:MAG: hydroxymethylglutaryl-CoA lyase [Methylibium sp.]|nr:hydroxymethylglutaryl-CoA lyase [Methylibium sp.]